MGGVQAAIDERLHEAASWCAHERAHGPRINTGDLTVVGVNKWKEGIPSPLLGGEDGGVFKIDLSEADETRASLSPDQAQA
jgi:(2R)-ethylmalonyl-CoA mutase